MSDDNKKEIEYSQWWKLGNGMMYNRDCLDANHPEQTYNYIKREFGVDLEDYGIYHPYTIKYKNYSREQLMSKCAELEQKLEEFLRHC